MWQCSIRRYRHDVRLFELIRHLCHGPIILSRLYCMVIDRSAFLFLLPDASCPLRIRVNQPTYDQTQARAYEKSIDFSRRPGVSNGASRRSLVRGVTATSHMLEAEPERQRSDEPTAGDGDPFCWAGIVGNSDISGRAAQAT